MFIFDAPYVTNDEKKSDSRSVNDIIAVDRITQSEVGTFMFLFLVIGIGLISLPVPTIIMTNAQASSGSSPTTTSNGGNSTGSDGTSLEQMGICEVGAGSPCNGESTLR